MLHYVHSFRRHLRKLVRLWESGALTAVMDSQRFVGLESVADAVERLQSGGSAGKVYVQVCLDSGGPCWCLLGRQIIETTLPALLQIPDDLPSGLPSKL